jgi:nitric oxide synthase oxygenase domain/subunit
MDTDCTFTIDIACDDEGIWTATCDSLRLFADAESYDELYRIAKDIACDMTIELGLAKDGQTVRLQFVQTQNVAVAA